MQSIKDCFFKVKSDCFKYISSQETKDQKFKNKDQMIRSFLIPVCFWISKKTKKKKTFNYWFRWRARFWKNHYFINYSFNLKEIF